ncbi:MAG TPA: glycosyltransferase [Polyangiaceae bacterium]|nr:glycosyltransferase [Polyangiaceae bacterium]
MGLNIAFFGSSLVSAYWNGAATYYRGILRALAARGHHTVFYEPDAYGRQEHRDIPDPEWARVVVYRGEGGLVHALDEARAADVLVKASGVGVFDELLERAVLDQRRRSQVVVFWDVDAPATLARMDANPSDPFRALVPQYDAIFTYGGGPPVVDAYTAFGARVCIPIYNALDPDTHHPAHPVERFRGDLGFLGNRLPDREARVDRFFFETARRLPERTFVLGGSGWGDKPMPANVRHAGHVYTHEHNAFNASALAVLNVNRESMAALGYSPATRVFEAAGAAACIVSDAWPGMECFLDPGHEVLIANDADEVVEHLNRLTPEAARRIGEAARRRVLAEHTYAQRAVEVERALSGHCLELSA